MVAGDSLKECLLTGCAVKDVITNAVKQNVCGTARGDARSLLGL